LVKRSLEEIIKPLLFKRKAIIIYGARQVGKTTLVESICKNYSSETLFLNGDESGVRDILSKQSAASFKPFFSGARIVVIDEAQRIPEIGLVLKIIHDNFKEIQLIATGSSSFDLANKIQEPLTGRKFEFFLHPFSFAEMSGYHSLLTEKNLVHHRLIYGYYPDIALNPGLESKLLNSLANSFLYKDLLLLEQIKKPVLLEKLLNALALQIGNEVSYNEIAKLVGSDKGTVEKYIDILEKAYIIFRLNGFNRNVRNELKKSKKIYFYDNGIRNSIISNFLPLSSRSDTGALWENFIINERIKVNNNNELNIKPYFWRTTQQQEIDYIEETNGKLYAYEFKWSKNSSRKAFLSKTFSNAYPETEFKVINPENVHEFLLKQ
jgi:hypothetical protein